MCLYFLPKILDLVVQLQRVSNVTRVGKRQAPAQGPVSLWLPKDCLLRGGWIGVKRKRPIFVFGSKLPYVYTNDMKFLSYKTYLPPFNLFLILLYEKPQGLSSDFLNCKETYRVLLLPHRPRRHCPGNRAVAACWVSPEQMFLCALSHLSLPPISVIIKPTCSPTQAPAGACASR